MIVANSNRGLDPSKGDGGEAVAQKIQKNTNEWKIADVDFENSFKVLRNEIARYIKVGKTLVKGLAAHVVYISLTAIKWYWMKARDSEIDRPFGSN